MTALKFEKMADVKANYDMFIKKLKPETHAEKIEVLKGKKEKALTKVKDDIDAQKQSKITEIKERAEAKKKELQQAKDSILESMQS